VCLHESQIQQGVLVVSNSDDSVLEVSEYNEACEHIVQKTSANKRICEVAFVALCEGADWRCWIE
jgi:hypothetical protein